MRWLDWVAAWLLAWGATIAVHPGGSKEALGVAMAVVVALATPIAPLRQRWRPVSALATFALSSRLGPGDRAWLVTPSDVVPVAITARRWFWIVIVGTASDPTEGIVVRRSRALLLPLEPRKFDRAHRRC
jgi:hypothetical protein